MLNQKAILKILSDEADLDKSGHIDKDEFRNMIFPHFI